MFINPQLTYKKLIKRRWSIQGSHTLPKHVLRDWMASLRLRSVQVGLVLHPAKRMALSWLIGASTKQDYTTSEMVPFFFLNYT